MLVVVLVLILKLLFVLVTVAVLIFLAVLVLAFTHSADNRLVSVLINKGETEKEILLPKLGSGNTINAYLSTDTLECALQKKVRHNKVTLPAKSIMTIIWR